MFVTIRKHQKWLWVIIAGLTIISFLIFGPTNARLTDSLTGRSGNSGHGRINGRPITAEEFRTARAEAFLFYFLGSGKWPDKDPEAAQRGYNATRETYFRLFWAEKERQLGIQASTQALADLARQVLANRITVENFEESVLRPEGLTLGDFESFLRHELGRQQLLSVAGLGGGLVTPQEAEDMYRKEHQDLSTVAAFFSVSNQLASVGAGPEAVAQYYQSHSNNYYIDRRVQVAYVKYEITNYLAAVQAKFTNLDAEVDSTYLKLGTNAQSFGTNTAEAKTNIRDRILYGNAQLEARRAAGQLADELDRAKTKNPAVFENLAKTNGLTVHLTAPFLPDEGPKDLVAPPDFTRTAFKLSNDEPFSGAIVGTNAVFVLALNKLLPPEIPPMSAVQDKVAEDYRLSVALQAARQAGESFAGSVTNGMADTNAFAIAAAAAKGKAEVLPPFSLSTQVAPEAVMGRVSMDLLKQVAFSTPAGKASRFILTEDGGFVLYVAARAPVDEAKMKKEFPEFQAYLRRSRENEAVNLWFNREINQDADLVQSLRAALEETPEFRGRSMPRSKP